MRIRPGSPDSPQHPQTPGAPRTPDAGFRGVMARRIAEASVAWQRALGAEPQWSAAPVLAAPPRPPGLESESPETARLDLHGIAATTPAGPAGQRVVEMLALRLSLEEKILARAGSRKG